MERLSHHVDGIEDVLQIGGKECKVQEGLKM